MNGKTEIKYVYVENKTGIIYNNIINKLPKGCSAAW